LLDENLQILPSMSAQGFLPCIRISQSPCACCGLCRPPWVCS
jgi:hypothetical protein